MRIRNSICCLFCVGLSVAGFGPPGDVYAQSSAEVRNFLARTPVSQLQYGTDKLADSLKTLSDERLRFYFMPSWVEEVVGPKRGEWTLYIDSIDPHAHQQSQGVSEEQARTECIRQILLVKKHLMVDERGTPILGDKSILSNFFVLDQPDTIPAGFFATLDEITKIGANVSYFDKAWPKARIYCSSPLRASKVTAEIER